jgi:GNAT superfamily N-acetyltransferase
MTFSVASISQLEIIQDLAKAIWPDAYSEILSNEQLNYMMEMMYSFDSLERQLKNNNVFLLAKEDNDFIGFASYELNFQNSNKTKIHKLYVLTNVQGKGVGKKMILHIQEIAKKNCNSALILNVNKYNKAKDFYLHNQFEIADSLVVDIGNGYVMDDFVMEKKI